MRRKLGFAVVGLVALVAASSLTLVTVYRASQRVPEFYQHALAQSAPVAAPAAELEQHVRDHYQAREDRGLWEAVITDQQINGWLASELEKKFPSLLPKEVRDPRVAITGQEVHVACRYEGSVSTVISFAAEVGLTDQPNVVAVRIRNVRAGVLPLPLTNSLERVRNQAARADLQLDWQHSDGDPVALVTLPEQYTRHIERAVHLQSVELRDGALHLSGSAATQQGPAATDANGP